MRLSFLSALTAAAALITTSANATTFFFAGPLDDAPTNAANINNDCGTVGADLCTTNFAAGFDYSKNGVSFNTVGYTGGTDLGTDGYVRGAAGILIQDLVGPNQGHGVISASEFTNGTPGAVDLDQINLDTGESVLYTFTESVTLTGIALNSGTSNDCPDLTGTEGPCGTVGVIVDGVLSTFNDFVANGVLAVGGVAVQLTGTTFEFLSLTGNAGYSIEQFTVSDVPVPAALPLLISGLLGLGFASRRRKKTA